MFEKLARKILKSEFESKERRVKEAEKNECELSSFLTECQEANRDLQSKNDNLTDKVESLTKKNKRSRRTKRYPAAVLFSG